MAQRQKSKTTPLFAALEREIQTRPWGTISQMEKALGWKSGWWQNRRKRSGDIDTQHLLAILDFLGLDPVGFVRETLGTEHGLELDEPQGPAPEFVELAWQRFRSGSDGAGLGEDFLHSVGEKGYHNPAAALHLVGSSIELARLTELPHLLGVAGSALRVQVKLRAAEHCFFAAIHVALFQGDHRTVGNLLRRYSYLMANYGRSRKALLFADQAVAMLVREGDTKGVAKGCIEQGLWLSRLGRDDEATSAFDSALAQLPESEPRYRCAGFQCLGVIYQRAGDHARALVCGEAAMEYLDSLSSRDRAKLLWLRASIHADCHELPAAVLLLEEAVRIFHEVDPVEAAVATCELVQGLLQLNRPTVAFQHAVTMHALMEPLADNPVISGAIAELLRSGKKGLTLALVDTVRGKIESERRRGTHKRD